jgi:aryl-alcohol dehydrogenase-like predicted oxidoreductase
MAQIGIAWLLSKPVVSAPIVGATKPHHLADATAALQIRLTDDEIRRLEQPYTTQPAYWW